MSRPARIAVGWSARSRDRALLYIDAWLEYKRAELPKISMRPHPYEFHLYFDA